MIKLIALYTKPADEAAFLRHYHEVHAPLVRRVPGLADFTVTRVTKNPLGGEPAYVLVAEMAYPDEATFKTAMRSPENAAVAADLQSFAAGLVTLLQGEVRGEADGADGAGTDASPDALRAKEGVPEPGDVLDSQHERDEHRG